MTGLARSQGPTDARRFDPLVILAVAALTLLTLALLLVGNGDLRLALAPVALTLVVRAAIKAPLRHSLLVLGFLCLTLENPAEAPPVHLWTPPFYTLGALLLTHMNTVVPVKALMFSGLDVLLVLLAGIWVARRMGGAQIDLQGHVPPAPPLRRAALFCLTAIALVWGYGMLRDGFSFANSLWQVYRVIYLPCIFLLFSAGLRGPADTRALGITLVAAALLRACIAIYLRARFPDTTLMPHATTHGDSMLFSAGVLLMTALFFERPSRKGLALIATSVPVLIWGMIANNRRLAWVELASCFLIIYFITPMTRLKRRVAQTVAVCIPAIALYAAIGWSQSSAAFAPVRLFRSVIDAQADTSTQWRELENYDLYYTLKDNPILGTGFGHEYTEHIILPDVARYYSLYRYAPHNSILGLLVYTGYVGFAGLWMIVPLGIFFAARSYRFSVVPRDRVAALTCVGVLVNFSVHCFGDMALGSWPSVFTVAPALALTAKQAVATGAWPLALRRDRTP